MINNPFGMHDREGMHLVPKGGICIDLVSLSDNPVPTPPPLGPAWFARVDWGYHGKGTVPLPQDLPVYLERLSAFVRSADWAHTIIIGNEPNHDQEFPQGVIIKPEWFAEVYFQAHTLIKSLRDDLCVAPGAIAPYRNTPMNWQEYQYMVLSILVAEGLTPDSLCCHAYTRSANPADIRSEAEMGPPLQGTYSGFLTYKDMLEAIPPAFGSLPVDITEFDEYDAWVDENTGVVRAAYKQIATEPRIRSLSLYRYPKKDKWHIEGKQGVISDYQAAIVEWHQNAQERPDSTKEVTLIPSIQKAPTKQPQPSTSFERIYDPEALKRGVTVEQLPDDQPGWRVKSINWFNEQESDLVGPDHHLLVKTLDEQGNPIYDVPVTFIEPTGFVRKRTENKTMGYPADNPMYANGKGYGVYIDDSPSEKVRGVGIGADTPGGWNAGIHTSTEVVFQRTPALTQKIPVSPPENPPLQPIPPLFHPVSNPKYRAITQRFGPSEYDYGNVKGHTGVDFAAPVGADVVAADNGRVLEAGVHPQYGNYVKLLHSWGETVYAHLNDFRVKVGDYVLGGEVMGHSGNTGFSEGAHLHFALRRFPYSRQDGWDGFSDPLPYLKGETPKVPVYQPNYKQVASIIRKEALDMGMDPNLMLALAWGESSFRSHLDDGLFQLGDQTWSEWSPQVYAKNINDPADNARVAAAYLKWLLKYFGGDVDKALTSWNMGIGNYLNGKQIPEITQEFVRRVKYGRDLLNATGG